MQGGAGLLFLRAGRMPDDSLWIWRKGLGEKVATHRAWSSQSAYGSTSMISAGRPRLRVSIVYTPADTQDGRKQCMREVLVHGREAGGRVHL